MTGNKKLTKSDREEQLKTLREKLEEVNILIEETEETLYSMLYRKRALKESITQLE